MHWSQSQTDKCPPKLQLVVLGCYGNVHTLKSVAVVSSSLSSSLFLRFNPLRALQPKRRLQQLLAPSPVPVPAAAAGSGGAAAGASAPVAIPVPPAWDSPQLQSQRACPLAVAVALACYVATKTRPSPLATPQSELSLFRIVLEVDTNTSTYCVNLQVCYILARKNGKPVTRLLFLIPH